MHTPILLLGLLLSGVTLAQSTMPVDGTPEPSAASTPEAPLLLYPNPTASVLHVEWAGRSLGRMPVEVRGLDGHLVLLSSLSPTQELDVSGLPDGFYNLLLVDLGGVRARKLFRVQR